MYVCVRFRNSFAYMVNCWYMHDVKCWFFCLVCHFAPASFCVRKIKISKKLCTSEKIIISAITYGTEKLFKGNFKNLKW